METFNNPNIHADMWLTLALGTAATAPSGYILLIV